MQTSTAAVFSCLLMVSAAYSQDAKELALGKAVAQQIENKGPRISDPAVQSYLNHLVNQIAPHAQLSYPVEIRAIRDDEPGAYGLPGGLVLITSGLLAKTPSEAALAAIIGHEIGHIATPALVDSPGATIPLVFIGCSRFIARPAVRVLAPVRAAEREAEADRLGYSYAVAAGFDPDTVRAALGYAGDGSMPQPAVAYVVNTSRFEAIRARFQEPEQARRTPPSLYR